MKVILYGIHRQVRQRHSQGAGRSRSHRRCSRSQAREGTKAQGRHRSPGRPQQFGKDYQHRQGCPVVSAYGPPPDDTGQIISATDRLVKGVLETGGPRLIVVGGAGSLFVAPGITLRESGHLPKEWIPIVDAHIQVLRNLEQSSIDWTYFSPAGFFEPGERTGKFRLGKDDLITDAQGNSRISFADYAIALVDELEKPEYHRERFTIGY